MEAKKNRASADNKRANAVKPAANGKGRQESPPAEPSKAKKTKAAESKPKSKEPASKKQTASERELEILTAEYTRL